MARRGSVTPAAEPEEPKLISGAALDRLMKALNAAESDKNTAVGQMGQLVSNAADKHGVNKKALGWLRACERLSPTKLHDLLEQFDHYRQLRELDERARVQEEMFSGKETGVISFADKVAKANAAHLNGKGNGATAPSETKVRRGRKRQTAPTRAEIEAIADRAERD